MMEDLTITIKPPITEYCGKCDYEVSRSFGSNLVKCPKCGEKSVYSGARPSEKQPVKVWRSRGRYNLCDRSEQYQYYFTNLPNGKRYSFVVDDEIDTDDAIDTALELKEIIDKYIYNSKKSEIAELVVMIDTDDFREEQEGLRVQQRKEQLERELYKLNHYHRCYNDS